MNHNVGQAVSLQPVPRAGFWTRLLVPSAAIAAAALLLLKGADSARLAEDEIWRHRNLGKAFYENPTTHAQAVEEFKKALDLAPDSARERLNYGLALLRNAGDRRDRHERQNDDDRTAGSNAQCLRAANHRLRGYW